jgi:hypothetical protein
VGDEQHAEPLFALDRTDRLEQGGLRGDVEHRGQLVADEIPRPQDERAREARPLQLPFGHLVREALEELLRQPHASCPGRHERLLLDAHGR